LDEVQPVMNLASLSQLQALVGKISIRPDVLKYLTEIVRATRRHDSILLGASPRGSIALMRASQCAALLSGKSFVTPDHVKRMAVPVLAHRLTLKSSIDSQAAEHIVAQVLEQVSVPVAATV
jgi:MoxR-like ATPase